MSATGAVYGDSFSAANGVSAGTTVAATTDVTAGGSVSATGAVNSGATISAVGNITGSYIFGNGSQLTGIDSTGISFGTSNVKIVAANANATISIGGTANVVVYATTGEFVTGLISATGNVIGGNISTGGVITATGNITGGNVSTGGLVTVTGNVNGGNINTVGLVSAGANVICFGNICKSFSMILCGFTSSPLICMTHNLSQLFNGLKLFVKITPNNTTTFVSTTPCISSAIKPMWFIDL